MPVKVTKTGAGLASVAKQFKEIQASDVLVGIPAETTMRNGDEMNNASLLYIFSNGSDLRNIPARPVLEPSITLNQSKITPRLGAAAKAVFDGHPEDARRELELAGTIAANGVKRYFFDPGNGWPANAPSTIAAKGSDQPGIDSGSMRRAITFVVRKNDTETQKPASGESVEDPTAGSSAEEASILGEVAEGGELLL
jgi:hypothetical protein